MADLPLSKLYRDSVGVLREGQYNDADLVAVDDRVTQLAGAMPLPANEMPLSEVTGAATGTQTARYALEDHQHPRLTSTTYATLGANATTSVPFTRRFRNKPGVVMTEIEASASQPLVCVVQSWIQDGADYTGCVIKGYRSQPLPSQSQLTLASLLTGVISGVNAIASTLTGFNVFGGSAAGATVSVIAVARSDMAST